MKFGKKIKQNYDSLRLIPLGEVCQNIRSIKVEKLKRAKWRKIM